MRPGRRIDRRDFLKAAAVLGGGLLGGKMPGIANAMDPGREDAAGGYFDDSLPPALRIRSGDTVAIETGAHRMGGMVLGARTEDWIRRYKERMARRPGTHFYPNPAHLAGPIHVEGAEPGDILQIEILEVIPAPCGFNIRPEAPFMENGPLADGFPKGGVKWFRTDPKTNEFGFLPEAGIPLRPFPAILGVRHAEDLYCSELTAGTVLYIPVRVRGAGVVTGNSRLAQGDGEFDASALEGAFRDITLRMTVRKELKKKVEGSFISTPTHWIAPGTHADPEEARRAAVRKSVRFLNAHCGMPDEEGYAFCRTGVDLRISRSGDHPHAVHAMIPKRFFAEKRCTSGNNLLL